MGSFWYAPQNSPSLYPLLTCKATPAYWGIHYSSPLDFSVLICLRPVAIVHLLSPFTVTKYCSPESYNPWKFISHSYGSWEVQDQGPRPR